MSNIDKLQKALEDLEVQHRQRLNSPEYRFVNRWVRGHLPPNGYNGSHSVTRADNGHVSPKVAHGALLVTGCGNPALSQDAQRLRDYQIRMARGHALNDQTYKAVYIATKYDISLRSARRYAKAGKEPSKIERIGHDGKIYHIAPRSSSDTRVKKNLRLAMQALARAEKHAQADGFDEQERQLLSKIHSLCEQVVKTWE